MIPKKDPNGNTWAELNRCLDETNSTRNWTQDEGRGRKSAASTVATQLDFFWSRVMIHQFWGDTGDLFNTKRLEEMPLF